jgi:hypothetical protein
MRAAQGVVEKGGVPLGILYKDASQFSFEDRMAGMLSKAKPKTARELVDSYSI